MAKDLDGQKTRDRLLEILAKDTNDIFVLQEVAKIHYFLRDYEMAWKYYDRFIQIKNFLGWEVFPGENAKIAFVLRHLEMQEEAQKYIDAYLDYIKNDNSIYRNLSYAAYYAMNAEQEKGIKYLQEFAKEQNFQYWIILFLEDDSIIEQLNAHPEYTATIDQIKSQFWRQHERLKKELEEKGFLKRVPPG